MNISVFIIIGVVIAGLGMSIGAAMSVDTTRDSPTKRPHREARISRNKRPSRKEVLGPMIIILGLSLSLLVLGYLGGNIIWGALGFILLFFGFGLLGTFLYQRLF